MALPNGVWTDLIEEFLDLTEALPSPAIFRLWSGISLVAGALERRVWAKVGDYQTFPNLYVLAVGHPGVGKQVVERVGELWKIVPEPGRASPALNVAPNSVSKASLMDYLGESKRDFLPPAGSLTTFYSLQVAAEEMGVFMPTYDAEFIDNLNYLFNCPPAYREKRRVSPVKKLEIPFPQLNLLMGATPAYFVGRFPEEAWTTGFIRRIIMVYAADTPFRELFEETPHQALRQNHLVSRLSSLTTLWGPMAWRPEAADRLRLWHRAGKGMGGPPVPTHSKLEHYCRSRTMHATKLAIVSAVSRSGELIIEAEDVERAIEWLVEAESFMPDIFRAMAGRSDMQVMEELHYFVTATYGRDGKKALEGQRLRRFLMARVPSDKVEKILELSDKAQWVCRLAGTDTWVPKPREEREVE